MSKTNAEYFVELYRIKIAVKLLHWILPSQSMFTIHRDLATGSWLGYGMFLQNIMLLAREQGLHTCPQAAWPDYHEVVRQVLPLSDEEMVMSGMAIGLADPHAIENTLATERVSMENNVTFLD